MYARFKMFEVKIYNYEGCFVKCVKTKYDLAVAHAY